MKKSTAAVLIAVVAVLLIGGVVLAGSMNDSEDTAMPANNEGMNTSGVNPPITKDDDDGREEVAAANTVAIRDFDFAPGTLTVKKGTTVTWTNEDSSKHDVTPDQETADFKASNLLAKGETYSVTFNTVGSYSYFCSPHPYMKGTIEVTE